MKERLKRIAKKIESVSEEIKHLGRKVRIAAITPEELEEWERFDFTKEEAERWSGVGFRNPYVAALWRDKDFTPEEARKWYLAGAKEPEEARRWKKYGFTPEIAKEWADYVGLDLEDFEDEEIELSAEWHKKGFTPKEAIDWMYALDIGEKKGDAEIAYAWKQLGFTSDEAEEWYKAFINLDIEIERKEMPRKAREWKNAGFGPEDVKEVYKWVTLGFRPIEAKWYISAGITDPKIAEEWRKVVRRFDISPKELIELIKEGLTPEEARKRLEGRS